MSSAAGTATFAQGLLHYSKIQKVLFPWNVFQNVKGAAMFVQGLFGQMIKTVQRIYGSANWVVIGSDNGLSSARHQNAL